MVQGASLVYMQGTLPGIYALPALLGRCTSLPGTCLPAQYRPCTRRWTARNSTFNTGVEEERVLPERKSYSHPENKPFSGQKQA